MEPKTLKSLEYDKILDMLKGYCQSSSAKNLAGSLLPTSDIEEVRVLLSETAEADKVLYDFSVDRAETVLFAVFIYQNRAF